MPWNAIDLVKLPGTLVFPFGAGDGYLLALPMDRDERCPCCGRVAKLVLIDPAKAGPQHVGCTVVPS